MKLRGGKLVENKLSATRRIITDYPQGLPSAALWKHQRLLASKVGRPREIL